MAEVETFFKAEKPEPKRKQWNSHLPAPKQPLQATGRRKKKRATRVTTDMRQNVYSRARGRCQADGLHHPDCPGQLTAGNWSAHHVWPKEHGGPDELDNLIAVWCPGGLGWNGCHGSCHNNPNRAIELGLLARHDRIHER